MGFNLPRCRGELKIVRTKTRRARLLNAVPQTARS
jgi:hypothetical protein